VCLFLWSAPLVAMYYVLGPTHVFVDEAVFFSKAAVVTLGGAYAVLAYIAQQAVERYGWLLPGEMLDGLGMAETTPGPLIMVVQFVGFMGAFRHPGTLDPLLAGVVGSIVTTWVTFVPCFLWIFLGAPFIEAMRGKRWLSAALSTITAAVVGVILNLAIWFALHILFAQVHETRTGPLRLLIPVVASVDLLALALSAGAFIALFRFKAGMLPTLATSALVGMLGRWLVP
jgi:chromate transporter